MARINVPAEVHALAHDLAMLGRDASMTCAGFSTRPALERLYRDLGPGKGGMSKLRRAIRDLLASEAAEAREEARLAARKITLHLTPDAKEWLADEGYDPVFGARPLKRVIQRHLQDQLAEMILSGDVLDGATVHVTVGPEGLIIGDRVSASRRERPSQAVVH